MRVLDRPRLERLRAYLSALMWPAFGEADFLRALRTYAERRRRSGQSASTTPAHD